ncbi:MAG: CPBP family intramembrane metalloprotease [Eubacteriales bacterium]|nr:CPBP family intramembrane metalloprotease [Eubacteriales bacterium]
MKTKVKKPLMFVMALLPIAVIGGLTTGIYTYESCSKEMQQTLLSQTGGYEPFLAAITLQVVLYAVICGFLGCILAEKVGLMRPIRFKKETWCRACLLGVISGLAFGLDYWIFGKIIPEVAASCENITISNFIASVLYGGIIEEVMLRLFTMSLIVFLIWKVFFRTLPKEQISDRVFIAANILSAIIFAAGHLPATFLTFEQVGAVVIFHCFLYNGGLGIVFGRLYRKYGIQYAMTGHILCHIVSKIIWIIFL